MNAEEIRGKLKECPTPWKLSVGVENKYDLDCGGSVNVIHITVDPTSISIAEIAAVLDMIEMAPAYIETLLAELKSLKKEMAFMGYDPG